MAISENINRPVYCATCQEDIRPGEIYRPVKGLVNGGTCQRCMDRKEKDAEAVLKSIESLDLLAIQFLAEKISDAAGDEDAAKEDANSMVRHYKAEAFLDALAEEARK